MTGQLIEANGISIAYDEFGERDNPTVMLVMGLGTQMIAWPEALCEDLASRGYHVLRFDNRDVGLSQKFDHDTPPNVFLVALFIRQGQSCHFQAMIIIQPGPVLSLSPG